MKQSNNKTYRWMIGLSLIVYHLSFSPVVAQTTFTQRIQKPVAGQGTVTIHEDEAIDKLVNSATLVVRPAAKTSSTPAKTGEASGAESTATASKEKTEVAPTDAANADAPKKPTRTYKTNGYRVQVYAGYNREGRQKAEQTRNNIRAQYANVSVYVHYNQPRWICRVGNYRTSEEAHQMLLSLRKLGYTEASVVKDKITVQIY